ASTNINDVVVQYLRSGQFAPRPAKATYSNAMDVGNPNNFPRLLDLCRGRLEYVQKEIWGRRATDEETLCEMKNVHERFGYLADPHTAVGVFCWEARSKPASPGKTGGHISGKARIAVNGSKASLDWARGNRAPH